ncbi:MAG: class I SAM-dependent methyltransferase [Patescibacteria group bacterium]|nr:class I SAM-dependent methyltransferase [Patescibacteria group bacterium]MDD5121024.1 class I SAM-dependent methyltransferase [Patescibacteria group bacterium]MDD5221615.1 class I SAM-dependent methyltransferase [Patescibacteria group bacterium]MDD5396057.1 class I SAM-dependent methyltransferase [Patescibacteria group bacterium]
MENKRIEMKSSWKTMAHLWASYAPPAKPSPIEINFFEQYLKKMLKKNKSLKALVLGSTPEFRDLLAKYKVDTTVVDNNPIYIKAMAQLTKRHNPKERTIISDWLTMSFKPNTFDLVLSDSAQDNIKFSEFFKLLNLLYKILKPTGCWFFGAICGRKDAQISFTKYVDLYRETPGHFRDFRNKTYRYFQLCFNREFYNTKTKKFNFKIVDTKVTNLVAKKKLSPSALKYLCFNLGDYRQTTLTQNVFEKILTKNFKILATKRDNSHIVMKNKWAAILGSKKS